MTVDLASSRPAGAADIEVIVRLADLGVVELDPTRGGALMLHHDMGQVGAPARYMQALEGELEHLVVGAVDGIVVGFGRASIATSSAATVCLIEELFVHPNARGVGVAARIIDDLRAWAVENHCGFFESYVLPGNRAAKNFFERLGMVTRKMRVSVDL